MVSKPNSDVMKRKYIIASAVMFFYIVTLAAICMLLSSCIAKPIPIAYNCPRITLPDDPALALKKLTTASTPDQAVKACWVDVSNLRGWNLTVRQQLSSSR